MMRAGQWVPVGPFQVCPDHDEDRAVLIYDEQTHELHVPREMGPFRIRVTAAEPGACPSWSGDIPTGWGNHPCGLRAGHAGDCEWHGLLRGEYSRWPYRERSEPAGPCALPEFQRDAVQPPLGGTTGKPGWWQAEYHGLAVGVPARCSFYWAGFFRCHRELGHEGAHRHPSVAPELPAVLQVQQCTAASATHRCVEPEFHVGPHDYRPHPLVPDNHHLFGGGSNGEAYTCPHGIRMGVAYPLVRCRRCYPTDAPEQG